MNADVLDAEHRQLATRDEIQPQQQIALFAGDPDEVVQRAVKVADALKKVVVAKGLIKRIQNRDFVEVAGWQTLGTMVGVTAFCEWSREIEGGWEARVVVRRNGADIGAAEAQCTRKENTWRSRDDYALRSMAQTRATSKALRSVLGFIVVLAGYSDTPAEEMPADAPPKTVEPTKETIRPQMRDMKDGQDHDPVRKGEAIDACWKLKRERKMSDALWRELLCEMFPQNVSAITKTVSEGDLSVSQLRELWAEANRRTKPSKE